jgi:hypothetical protein
LLKTEILGFRLSEEEEEVVVVVVVVVVCGE